MVNSFSVKTKKEEKNNEGYLLPGNKIKRLPLVLPVEEEKGKGKAEPNADKAQLLLGRCQGCVHNLIGYVFPKLIYLKDA